MAGKPLKTLVAELAMNGMYEPGAYVKQADLRTSELHEEADGSVWFYVDTTEPNTDRERVQVTVSAPRLAL